jgi:hypothetical protein
MRFFRSSIGSYVKNIVDQNVKSITITRNLSDDVTGGEA